MEQDKEYFVVPIKHLEQILFGMTDNWNEWNCSDEGDEVIITHFTQVDTALKTVAFVFPMVLVDGIPSETVLLCKRLARQVHKSVYLEGNEFKNDPDYDWEKFWASLLEVLMKKAKTN
jgi:hypothetical protein